jgi:pimeloyl-ACP methyl ester carboxylesterase
MTQPQFPPPLAAFGGDPPPAPAWFAAALADEPERGFVVVQGAPIETLAWGRVGDPGLLLLHGNSAHADWYSCIAPLLRQGRRVVAFSFSGMGASGWRTQYSVAQWADEALAVAEASGLFAAAVLPTVVAHSFGGFPLMNLAARHGQRLALAVVVDTPMRPPRPDGTTSRRAPSFGNHQRSARVYSTQAQALMRFRLMPPQGCEHPYVADLIARRGLKTTVGPNGQTGWVWRFDPHLFAHFDFGKPAQDLRNAGCPLAVMRGGRSRLMTAQVQAHVLTLAPPGTRSLELPDADHHLMLDQPQAFAALLAALVPAA